MDWQNFKIIFSALLFLTCQFYADFKAFGITASPETQVRGFIHSIQQLKTIQTTTGQKEKIHTTLLEKFDYEKFAERALWDQRDHLTSEEMEEFLEIFPKCFEKKIFSQINKIKTMPRSFQIRKLREENGLAQVQLITADQKGKIVLDLFLIKKNSAWKVFDLSVNKANLTQNYQSQFNRIIRLHGFKDLLARMQREYFSIVPLKSTPMVYSRG